MTEAVEGEGNSRLAAEQGKHCCWWAERLPSAELWSESCSCVSECLHMCVIAWVIFCVRRTSIVCAFVEVYLCLCLHVCVGLLCQWDYKKTNGRNWWLLGWRKVWINHLQPCCIYPVFLMQLQKFVWHSKASVCARREINTSICSTIHFLAFSLIVDAHGWASAAMTALAISSAQAMQIQSVKMIHIKV